MLEDLKNIAIADFDYALPDDRIARFPMAERDHSKLLMLRDGSISEHHFYDLPSLLPSSSLLVFNDTKVIHARLFFQKPTGAIIEVFCLEPYEMPVAQSFEQRKHCSWVCFVGNNKKWKEGPLTLSFRFETDEILLSATRRESVGNSWVVDFDWTGGISFAEVIEFAGVIPLPPYLDRDAEESDSERYQTIYAHYEGSVAAPTAGLHFTDRVLQALRAKGVEEEYLTLHVGAGTFKPVSTSTIGEHDMHVEKVQATADNIQHIMAHNNGRVVAVGTTSVRTLESIYWFGVQLHDNPMLERMHVNQWDPYMLERQAESISLQDSFDNVLQWLKRHKTDHLDGETQLMIAPGYRYRVIQGLITNFHQPKSTLLLLVSALIGDRWRDVYQYALNNGFRFLSYGDSCLFLK